MVLILWKTFILHLLGLNSKILMECKHHNGNNSSNNKINTNNLSTIWVWFQTKCQVIIWLIRCYLLINKWCPGMECLPNNSLMVCLNSVWDQWALVDINNILLICIPHNNSNLVLIINQVSTRISQRNKVEEGTQIITRKEITTKEVKEVSKLEISTKIVAIKARIHNKWELTKITKVKIWQLCKLLKLQKVSS